MHVLPRNIDVMIRLLVDSGSLDFRALSGRYQLALKATHLGMFVALSFYEEDWSKYDDVKAFGAPCFGPMRLAHAFARSMHAFAGVVLSCIGPAWPPRDCLSK